MIIKMFYVAWHSSIFEKQACSLKTGSFVKCAYIIQHCFGQGLNNGSVEGSYLNRWPKCEWASV